MTDGGAVCPAVFRCLRGVGNMAKKMNPVAEGFYALGKDITDIGVTFADGDWKTRVSYLIFGFGPLMRGQIVKGLGFLLCEALRRQQLPDSAVRSSDHHSDRTDHSGLADEYQGKQERGTAAQKGNDAAVEQKGPGLTARYEL